MPRFKLTLEYFGPAFAGWQRQAHAMGVQQVLEDAIEKFCQQQPRLHVAGRTDAGVHASGQVAHVDIAKDVEADTVRDALNFHVRPHPVVVVECARVDDDFHARFHCTARRYRYLILNRPAPPALAAHYCWHVPRALDVPAMQEAANTLRGTHDFSTFRAQGCQSNSPIKTLDELRFEVKDAMVIVHVRAPSFLYHQVRNMVGTLAQVGTRQWDLSQFQAALAAKNRAAGGPTAPPQGLYFVAAHYDKTVLETGLPDPKDDNTA